MFANLTPTLILSHVADSLSKPEFTFRASFPKTWFQTSEGNLLNGSKLTEQAQEIKRRLNSLFAREGVVNLEVEPSANQLGTAIVKGLQKSLQGDYQFFTGRDLLVSPNGYSNVGENFYNLEENKQTDRLITQTIQHWRSFQDQAIREKKPEEEITDFNKAIFHNLASNFLQRVAMNPEAYSIQDDNICRISDLIQPNEEKQEPKVDNVVQLDDRRQSAIPKFDLTYRYGEAEDSSKVEIRYEVNTLRKEVFIHGTKITDSSGNVLFDNLTET